MRLFPIRTLTFAPSRFVPLARLFVLLFVAVTCLRPASASVTVLVGEPFGSFGTMMPVGHTAVFLDHLCADGPLKLRACHPGEPEGVVIARYHQLGQYDFLVSPVMEFLYAAERPEDVLAYATLDNSWELRQIYRRKYLAQIVPDGHEYDKATDEWWESGRNRLHPPHLGLLPRHHARAGPALRRVRQRSAQPPMPTGSIRTTAPTSPPT